MTGPPVQGPPSGRRDLPELRVPVTELRRRLGNRREVSVGAVMPGLSVSTAEVPTDEALALDVTLESISGAVTIEGTLVVPWWGPCRRCLNPVRGQAEVAVSEVAETHPTEGETWPLEPDVVDLNALVAELALVALPLAPLCGPDCAGPEPETAPVLVEDAELADDSGDTPADGERGDGAPKGDPRWAVLDELGFNDR